MFSERLQNAIVESKTRFPLQLFGSHLCENPLPEATVLSFAPPNLQAHLREGCTTPGRLPTRWKIEQHTLVKHAILKAYLDAWFPILGGTYLKLVYVDGFAGPGLYEEGQIGSPVIAIETALRHKLGPQRKWRRVFAEKTKTRRGGL